jgi:hypothetical protein
VSRRPPQGVPEQQGEGRCPSGTCEQYPATTVLGPGPHEGEDKDVYKENGTSADNAETVTRPRKSGFIHVLPHKAIEVQENFSAGDMPGVDAGPLEHCEECLPQYALWLLGQP